MNLPDVLVFIKYISITEFLQQCKKRSLDYLCLENLRISGVIVRPKDWGSFFSNISSQLTVSLIAKPKREGDENLQYFTVESNLPVFDAIDVLGTHEFLILPDGRIVKRQFLLKRPLRIVLGY